jgi:type IV pilus assembly protein PilE
MMKQARANSRGFTLLELMIAVVVVSILAAVAYPSYLTRIQKSRRSDATSGLVAAAQSMERYFTEHATYVGATFGSGASDIYLSKSTNDYYGLAITSQTASGFTLKATPKGTQTNDSCGNFTYDQAGTKGASGGSVATCW